MVSFFVVKLSHICLNIRFNVSVTYLCLIILSVRDDIFIEGNVFFDRLHKSQDQPGPVDMFIRT
jgi:hypothetical protein